MLGLPASTCYLLATARDSQWKYLVDTYYSPWKKLVENAVEFSQLNTVRGNNYN